MCGVNELDHNGLASTPALDSRRHGRVEAAAGCDQILVFGGFPVYEDTGFFGKVSTVDTTGSPTNRAPATQEGSGHSTLIPIGPARLLETRTGPGLGTVDGGFSGQGIRPPDSVLALGVVGRAQLPSWARSVVLNVTVTGALGSGFLTVYPCEPAPTDLVEPQLRRRHDPSGRRRRSDLEHRRLGLHLHPDTDACARRSHRLLSIRRQLHRHPAGSLLETRVGPEFATVDGQLLGIGRRTGVSTTEVKVTGRGGVPDECILSRRQRDSDQSYVGRLHHRLSMRRGDPGRVDAQLRRRVPSFPTRQLSRSAPAARSASSPTSRPTSSST